MGLVDLLDNWSEVGRELRVLVWRRTVLPGSETFIRNQIEGLSHWKATLAGLKKVDSAVSRSDDVILLGNYPLLRKVFELTGSSRLIREYVVSNEYDVIHAHFSTNGWLISGSARRVGVPLVLTVHAHDVTSLLKQGDALHRRATLHKIKTVFRRATKIIAVSDYIAKIVIGLGADPDKVVTHYIGTPLRPMQSAKKEWDVLFVGRLVEKKGVLDLLRASALLRGRQPRVAVVGEGPLRRELERYAEENSIDVSFLGQKNPEEVRLLMESSSLLAAPSKTSPDGDIEGLPTVIVEALAVGVPVVATLHSGIPEAVEHERNGLLVDEGDFNGLAEAIDRLLSDSALHRDLSTAARLTAETKFDVVKQCASLEQIYRDASDKTQTRSRGGLLPQSLYGLHRLQKVKQRLIRWH